MKFDGSSSQSGNKDRKADDSDSAASVGSLEAIDVVDEDLNRNEDTRAAGFFGKSSEVSWMQRLEGEVENTRIDHGLVGIETPDLTSQPELQDPRPKGSAPPRERQDIEIPLASMNYHLDDLEIPVINDSNPFVIPPRETADEYFNAYMTYVHPTFSVIRKTAFTAQYLQFFERWAKPPQKWLGILNMIFALGSHYYNLANPLSSRSREDGLVFLTRARQLCLTDNVLFEHADLQQIQLEFLVALYLLCLGQVNR
ncbi:hypothetical protein N7462_000150 [Penicillium macrosclerotiorum]|uniref:uncharacterized protein n=1 Tax=Penicillium macrosclerotiorum TaxID=303699 RepID=UPI0025494AE9|nr:uncharacterized protein N7462_000150 [Penicillium macrosclerotiorum]KAJ5698145.1 hypothetical protein N7462_000150 [Penicillium macrosclerotiorum]